MDNLNKVDAKIDDVADHFGVSTRTIRRWMKKDGLPFRKVGGSLRFSIEEVDEWSRQGVEAA